MEWVVIKVAENLSLAELYKQLLEKSGIPVILRSSGAAAYMGPSASQEIIVPQRYKIKAQKNIIK